MLLDHNSANWSEMGAKKTSSGLWLIQRLVEELEIENPSVLIVTTRTGKGTFFKLAPHILKGWTIFNVDTKGISVFIDGKERRLPAGDITHVPEKFGMPALVVTHFHIFSKSNKGQWLTDKKGQALRNDNGGLIMKPPTQADAIAKHEWDFQWLDEAHRIKDKDTKWTVVIKRVKSKYRHISTGTGFINRPNEIWSPLNFLDKELWSSYWNFHEYFCEIDDWDGYSKVVGVKPEHKEEFRQIVREYGPRRTLDEVMPHIKKPIFVERLVDLNPTQQRMFDAIKHELFALDQAGAELYASNVLSLLLRLRQITVATPEVIEDYYDEELDRRVQKIKLVEPSSKLDEVMDILDSMRWDEDHKEPVVIFSNFVDPIKLLQARFEKANRNAVEMGFEPEYPYLWMKDSDDDQTRYRKWVELFPSLQYRVFMSTVQIGGESISLTAARHLIFLDKSWSPKDNNQAVGRIRRPGQEGQPVVISINARNTTDQRVDQVLKNKQNWFNDIFGEEAGPPKAAKPKTKSKRAENDALLDKLFNKKDDENGE